MDNLLKSEILESIPPTPTPPSGSGNIDIYPGGGAKGGLGTTAEGKT